VVLSTHLSLLLTRHTVPSFTEVVPTLN